MITVGNQATQASTNRSMVKNLCGLIVNRLENQKAIACDTARRHEILDALFREIGPFILTEEDLRSRTLERVGARAGEIIDREFAESEQFKAARAVVRKEFGDDELNGFYFQKPLIHLAGMVSKFLMRNECIEEVFEPDEILERKVVESFRRFNPAELH